MVLFCFVFLVYFFLLRTRWVVIKMIGRPAGLRGKIKSLSLPFGFKIVPRYFGDDTNQRDGSEED